jgi:drug/metabolite transporter (DMT)-like permease
MSRPILSTSAGLNQGVFRSRDWANFVAISLIWGSSFLFIDIGLEAFAPGVITWLRVALGAATLALFPKSRSAIDREDLPRIVVLSLVWVAIPFTLFPLAQQWINSAVAGMLNGGMPIFAAIVATLMLRRAPRGMLLIGLVVGFSGVVLISLPSIDEGTNEAIGVILVLAAVACYGLAVNIAAPIQQRYGSLPVMMRMLGLAGVWTLPFALFGVPDSGWQWSSFLAVATAGAVGTGIAFVVMGWLVGSVGSTRASFSTYAIPVVAIVLGVVFRGDVVDPIALVGIALVIVGAVMAGFARRVSTESESTE